MEECNSPYSGISELADAEQGLLNYYSNIIDLVAGNFLKTKSSVSEISVLEFGAGTGFLSELLQEKFNVKADCLEIDSTLLEILQQKGFKTYSKLSDIDKKYDLIFSSNVLEHIEKDVEVLSDLRQLLKTTGKLVNYIPAFPILFSGLDVSVGHFRRYTKRELKLKLKEAGYKVDKIHYVDSLGFPASLLLRIIGYKSRGNIGGLRSMGIYDRYIFPFSKILDQIGFKRLFGKNIVVYASLKG
jgi:SAM-dependent methyltransferase